MSRCYAYKIAPIDVGFDHLVSVDDYILYLARYEVNRLLDFISSWDFAKNLAIDAGWEGDIREGPFVFFLPFPDSSEMGFAFIFKQENNGDTMVVSPVRLEWLSESCDSEVASDEIFVGRLSWAREMFEGGKLKERS